MSEDKQLQVRQIRQLNKIVESKSVTKQFENALKENSGVFIASLIELYSSDTKIQECDPKLVVIEALKAATLNLPIIKSLGHAWIIQYNDHGIPKPRFQIGYKGYIQLAIRSGEYETLNANFLYKGERIDHDKLSGKIKVLGEPESDEVIGYFAYLETLEGYKKALYWTKELMTIHARAYSPSYGRKNSTWTTEFDKMGRKTMIKTLLSGWGLMTPKMAQAFNYDSDDMKYQKIEREVQENSNTEAIDIDTEPVVEELPKDKPDF